MQSEQSSVPFYLNKFQFVFLLLSLIFSDDDQISIGALVNVLRRVRNQLLYLFRPLTCRITLMG